MTTYPQDDPLLQARMDVEEAERLRRARQLDRSQEICERLLRRHPDHCAALQTIAMVLIDKKDTPAALPYLTRAAMANPQDWFTIWVLSRVYLDLGARGMAAKTLEHALQLKPDDPNLLVSLGDMYREEREYEAAAEVYRKALRVDAPREDAPVEQGWMGLGLTTAHLGEPVEAAAAFHKLVSLGVDSASLLYSLAQLPASLVEFDVLSLIGKSSSKRERDEDLSSLLEFATAAALEKAGRHAESWQQLVKANRRIFPRFEKKFRKNMESEGIFIAAQKARAVYPGPGVLSDDLPISLHILGPSRSGKTTMEKLVGLLDGVKRGFENPIAQNAARRASQIGGFPTIPHLHRLPPHLDANYLTFYTEELRQRAGSAKVFTNTTPGRIYDASRMGSFIPNMRFVFIKRDVDDITLRIFGKKYRKGNEYAYDIRTIREHVVSYYRLMDIIAERLPRLSIVLNYEDMITNPEAALASVAQLCGLPPPDIELPPIGDDRGCAEPYRQWMHEALAA